MLLENIVYTIGLYFFLCWLFDVEDIYTMSRRNVWWLPDFKAIWMGVVGFIDGFLLRDTGNTDVDAADFRSIDALSDGVGGVVDGETLSEAGKEGEVGDMAGTEPICDRDISDYGGGGDVGGGFECGEGEPGKALAVKSRVKLHNKRGFAKKT